MGYERNLDSLLVSLEPVRRAGTFVFVAIDDEALLRAIVPEAEATIREEEGLTAVVARDEADALGLPYEFVAAWIMLRVHSALDAIGLTATVSSALAEAGMPCNVIAGYHHDHLLVPADRDIEAIGVLSQLSLAARSRASNQ